MRRKHDTWLNEFTALGVFLGVSVLGLFYGAILVLFPPSQSMSLVTEPVRVAPTTEDYQAEVRRVMQGFLGQYALLSVDDLALVQEPFGALIQKTQDRMITVIVPADFRDTHLKAVLLLEAWKGALAGSVVEQEKVFADTDIFLSMHAWLNPVGI